MNTSKLLVRSFYKPARGGHAPDDLRYAWQNLVDALHAADADTPEPLVEVRGQSVTALAITRLMWNCTDLLSNSTSNTVRDMGCEFGRNTYASASRAISAMLEETVSA